MNCEQCRSMLEAYLDGELDAAAATGIATHISTCSACATEYDGQLREQEAYSGYQRGIEIRPALWNSVKAAIEQEKAARTSGFQSRPREKSSRLRAWFGGGLHAPLMSPAWVAAIVLVAMGLTVLFMAYLNGRTNRPEVAKEQPAVIQPAEPRNPGVEAPKPQPTAPGIAQTPQNPPLNPTVARAPKSVTSQPRTAPAQPTAAELVQQAEEKYLAAIAILSRDVNKNRSQLDSATVARFDDALNSINRTIAETRRAVREHPGDPVAAQYMLMAYAEKVEVLKEMAGAQ
jgi:hypothetical protein